ncbi:MAG: hypothetical protein H7Y30_10925 [Pyrinomonadaceae bacterium]|nr:hypothetical protein [Pyrinomonadaceae bacterium]
MPDIIRGRAGHFIAPHETEPLRAEIFRFFYTLKADGVITNNPDLAEKAKTK